MTFLVDHYTVHIPRGGKYTTGGVINDSCNSDFNFATSISNDATSSVLAPSWDMHCVVIDKKCHRPHSLSLRTF